MGIRDATNRGVGRESTKLFRIFNLPWHVFEKKTFTKIEAYAGMSKTASYIFDD